MLGFARLTKLKLFDAFLCLTDWEYFLEENFHAQKGFIHITPAWTYVINELDLFWVLNFIALRIYFILGSNFSGMRGLILVLMSSMCYLAVTWWLLGGYCSLPSGYCSLLHVTWWLLLIIGGYWLLPLATIVPTFSMNSTLAPYLVWRFLRIDRLRDLISCQTRPFPQISKYVPKLN